MTIINHTQRFVFVHIPKNAGTSVSVYLSQLSTYRDQEIGSTELGEAKAPLYRRRFRLHKHSTLREIEAVMGAEELAGYTTFAVVRDPYDRVRSIFSFLRSWKGWVELDPVFQKHAAAFAGFEDVDEFVMSELFLTPGPDRLFLPQATWICDDQDAVSVDRILDFASLDDDMAGLVDDLRLPRDRLKDPLQHTNVSRGRRLLPNPLAQASATREPPDHRFRTAAADRIRERYARDLALLAPARNQAPQQPA